MGHVEKRGGGEHMLLPLVEVPDSNPASSIMIRMRCRIIV